MAWNLEGGLFNSTVTGRRRDLEPVLLPLLLEQEQEDHVVYNQENDVPVLDEAVLNQENGVPVPDEAELNREPMNQALIGAILDEAEQAVQAVQGVFAHDEEEFEGLNYYVLPSDTDHEEEETSYLTSDSEEQLETSNLTSDSEEQGETSNLPSDSEEQGETSSYASENGEHDPNQSSDDEQEHDSSSSQKRNHEHEGAADYSSDSGTKRHHCDLGDTSAKRHHATVDDSQILEAFSSSTRIPTMALLEDSFPYPRFGSVLEPSRPDCGEGA